MNMGNGHRVTCDQDHNMKVVNCYHILQSFSLQDCVAVKKEERAWRGSGGPGGGSPLCG